MSYDKTSGTIKIQSDDPKDFERDLIVHMAHVTSEVDKEIASRKVASKASDQGEQSKKGGPMKWIAIANNIALLGFVLYMVSTKGMPRDDELLLALLFFAAPISSLLALTVASGESWLGLYFKRKALEERRRIEALEKS